MEDNKEKKIVLCYPSPKIGNQVKPTEFLEWAKSDLNGNDKRARGNALGNIKKAIHSRIDEIINSTHLTFGSDWNWKKITTEKKLSILKKLGIDRGEIAKIITEQRDTYEHQYILPPLNTIRAYRDITEWWLNDSYKKYDFYRIAIFNLPVYDVIIEQNKIKKIILSDEYKGITFFWDRKKEYYQTSKDKSLIVKKYSSMTWEEILSFEKRCIKNLGNKEIYSLSQLNLTKIFNTYNQKARTKYHGFFRYGIHVKL